MAAMASISRSSIVFRQVSLERTRDVRQIGFCRIVDQGRQPQLLAGFAGDQDGMLGNAVEALTVTAVAADLRECRRDILNLDPLRTGVERINLAPCVGLNPVAAIFHAVGLGTL